MFILLACFCVQSSKYYKGGFEPKMSKREASLILGVRYFFVINFVYSNFFTQCFAKGVVHSRTKQKYSIALKAVQMLVSLDSVITA